MIDQYLHYIYMNYTLYSYMPAHEKNSVCLSLALIFATIVILNIGMYISLEILKGIIKCSLIIIFNTAALFVLLSWMVCFVGTKQEYLPILIYSEIYVIRYMIVKYKNQKIVCIIDNTGMITYEK